MKVHQNIVIDGKDYGDGAVRKHSAYCNEGKWKNFIEPFLLNDCTKKVFVEYGSNAGLYLSLAEKRGFERVFGIERNSKDVIVAEKYRKHNKQNYTNIKANIDDTFDFNSLPVADITLLANFHYHQHIREFMDLLDILETRTHKVIVVSVELDKPHWRAQPGRENVEYYFRRWFLEDKIPLHYDENDPHPRKMFSYLFESSKIRSLPTEMINIRKMVSGQTR